MRNLLWVGAAMAVVVVGPARGDIVYKPIDTDKYVVKPSRAAANVAAQTIETVGQTAGNSLKNNGYVKTINNLFSKKIIVPTTQRGPSPLPSPNLFPSTQYKNYNTPVAPQYQPVRRP